MHLLPRHILIKNPTFLRIAVLHVVMKRAMVTPAMLERCQVLVLSKNVFLKHTPSQALDGDGSLHKSKTKIKDATPLDPLFFSQCRLGFPK